VFLLVLQELWCETFHSHGVSLTWLWCSDMDFSCCFIL